jgi:hypothetical protein
MLDAERLQVDEQPLVRFSDNFSAAKAGSIFGRYMDGLKAVPFKTSTGRA